MNSKNTEIFKCPVYQTYSIVFKRRFDVCNTMAIKDKEISIFNIDNDIYIQINHQFFRYNYETRRFVFDKYISDMLNTNFGINLIYI